MAKLKIYDVDSTLSIMPGHVRDAVQLPRHSIQSPWYVAAPTKVAALAWLDGAGFRATARELRVASDDTLMAVLDAGLLGVDGEIVAWADYTGGDQPVARIAPGEREPQVVGRWRYVRHVGDLAVFRKFLVRDTDGAMFPARWHSKPATPATGWTPEMETRP